MSRIYQLPTEVITKIAAGEVIERPASVVKELLENSIDAGATRVDVAVEQGGTEIIRVVDDGLGICADDLPLAFTGHATSKLKNADDLFRVHSLGFRGEALASIGGVSQAVLQSRPRDEIAGSQISCEGGRLGPVSPWNGAVGTRIEIRRLFYNTPVRRKFLRTTGTEMGHISESVLRLAIAHRDCSFRLTHNDRKVWEVPSSADLEARIRLFFGPEVADKLIPIRGPDRGSTSSTSGVKLFGYVVDPAISRGNTRMQYLFVNGRWTRDRALGHALQESFRGLLMTGRCCAAFLFIELSPDRVDVNVHPTKSEVRFRDAQAVYHLLLSTIREQLRKENLTPGIRLPGPQLSLNPAPIPTFSYPENDFLVRSAPSDPISRANAERSSPQFAYAQPESGFSGAVHGPPAQVHAPADSARAGHYEPLSKAIQLHNAYIVIETPEGMLVIDQHALHERIIYEEWKTRIRQGLLEQQKLLVPEPVDLPKDQAGCALEHRAMLGRAGLGIEEFGGGTILVISIPSILRKGTPEKLLRTAVEFLLSNDHPPDPEQLLDELLKRMACRSAIMAGDPLGPQEIEALVSRRDLADHTHHCPHGRPTALLLSREELDRQFKRI